MTIWWSLHISQTFVKFGWYTNFKQLLMLFFFLKKKLVAYTKSFQSCPWQIGLRWWEPATMIAARYGAKYSRMDQVKFVEDSLKKISSDMACRGRTYPFKFFKGCCLPHIKSQRLSSIKRSAKTTYHHYHHHHHHHHQVITCYKKNNLGIFLLLQTHESHETNWQNIL